MCGCSTKNQTTKKVLAHLEAEVESREMSAVKGIGMFVLPAPENGILENKVVRVGDLDYVETQKRGHNCVAFKWLPYGYAFEHDGKTVRLMPGDERKPWICIPNRCITQDCTDGCACTGKHCG